MKKIIYTSLICIGLCLPSAEGQQTFARKKVDNPKDATEMVEIIRNRVPTQTIESRGVLRVRAPKKETRYIPIRFSVRPISKTSWESLYETDFATEDNERLTIISSVDKPNKYTLSRKKSGQSEWISTHVITGKDSAVRFADTDFWFCDLGLEFLEWPKQIVLRREMRKGRPCRVLQSSYPEGSNQIQGTMYGRVVSWVDNESDGIVMAQAFDTNGKRVKEFEIQSLKKVDGVWQLKQMTIFDNQKDSRTTLEIDLEITDSGVIVEDIK